MIKIVDNEIVTLYGQGRCIQCHLQ